jgi:hypothetical protein
MCLRGMLAAEFETLPKAMQTALDRFLHLNERWLVTVAGKGRSGGPHFKGTASGRRSIHHQLTGRHNDDG